MWLGESGVCYGMCFFCGFKMGLIVVCYMVDDWRVVGDLKVVE